MNFSQLLIAVIIRYANETRPVFTGKVRNSLHMDFEDPSHVIGTDEFTWSEFRRVRDEIKEAFKKLYVE